MSEVQELQDEEREALISIYEGDAAFKQINPTTYSYKVIFSIVHNLAYPESVLHFCVDVTD